MPVTFRNAPVFRVLFAGLFVGMALAELQAIDLKRLLTPWADSVSANFISKLL
jgi:hypothetical protein